MLLFLGLLCFLIAVVDAVGLLFGLSLTEVGWAPLLFAVLGFMFVYLEDAERRRRPS